MSTKNQLEIVIHLTVFGRFIVAIILLCVGVSTQISGGKAQALIKESSSKSNLYISQLEKNQIFDRYLEERSELSGMAQVLLKLSNLIIIISIIFLIFMVSEIFLRRKAIT